MAMTDNNSLLKFLDKYTAIEVPILQRDYAQGRIDPKTKSLNLKGENFIKVLFRSMQDAEGLNMDIIYGSIETRNPNAPEERTFIPLDGQQRLTTLWLLHWYLAQWEGKNEEFSLLLRRFTYATRSTARDFCKRLCSMTLDREDLASPSEYFSQRMWFTSKYDYDPTIQAMLNMLDTIAKELKNQPRLSFNQLERLQFRSFDIGLYELTDDLYIKMNKRGKPLESIENLKADFVGYLKKRGHNFSAPNSYDRKLDHSWADMAWGQKGNDGFDIRYLHLFNRYFYNLWILEDKEEDASIPEYLKLHFTGEDYRGFEAYENILSTSEDRLERMVYFFDFLASDKGVSYSKLLLNPWKNKEDQEEPSYPYMLDRKEISIQDRIALYALMLYIDTPSKECPEDLQRYESWMRIVWNLIAAPQLRTYQTQKHYMELLSKLAPYSREIESFLLKTDPQEIGIGGTDSGELIRRLKLEQEKLQYLKKYPNRREDLLKAEAIPCLQGQVGFLLKIEKDDTYFSHIVEQSVNNIKPDWWETAENLWPALIALLEEPLFTLPNEGNFDYLSHEEHGSKIKWRLQDLLNRPHIAEALRKLLDECLKGNSFKEVCKKICENYEWNKGLYWHYPLVTSDILRYAGHGRIYHRWGEGICLQRSWRVTENEWCGYWCLSDKKPILYTTD